jgi:hypothetical protein
VHIQDKKNVATRGRGKQAAGAAAPAGKHEAKSTKASKGSRPATRQRQAQLNSEGQRGS